MQPDSYKLISCKHSNSTGSELDSYAIFVWFALTKPNPAGTLVHKYRPTFVWRLKGFGSSVNDVFIEHGI